MFNFEKKKYINTKIFNKLNKKKLILKNHINFKW